MRDNFAPKLLQTGNLLELKCQILVLKMQHQQVINKTILRCIAKQKKSQRGTENHKKLKKSCQDLFDKCVCTLQNHADMH